MHSILKKIDLLDIINLMSSYTLLLTLEIIQFKTIHIIRTRFLYIKVISITL